jgi:hypothetical protein
MELIEGQSDNCHHDFLTLVANSFLEKLECKTQNPTYSIFLCLAILPDQ